MTKQPHYQFNKGSHYDSQEEMISKGKEAKAWIEKAILESGLAIPPLNSPHWRVIKAYDENRGRMAVRIDCLIPTDISELPIFQAISKDFQINIELFND